MFSKGGDTGFWICLYSISWVAIGLCGCGDNAPTGPTSSIVAPTPTSTAASPQTEIPQTATMTIVSGETHQPVEAAEVTIAGKSYKTDRQGQINLNETPSLGSNIEIAAPGFLDRKTLLRSPNDLGFTQLSEGHLFTLWPETSANGLHKSFTRELLYVKGGDVYPLYRPDPRFKGAVIIPDNVVKRDQRTMQTVREAAAAMTEATGKPYIVGRQAKEGAKQPIHLVYDPLHPNFRRSGWGNVVAFVDNEYDWGHIITSSTVVFRVLEYARVSVTLHELGHTIGLSHTTTQRDVMSRYYYYADASEEFTPRERLVIQLMLQRRPGNTFPDNDRMASQKWSSHSHRRSGHLIIACGEDGIHFEF